MSKAGLCESLVCGSTHYYGMVAFMLFSRKTSDSHEPKTLADRSLPSVPRDTLDLSDAFLGCGGGDPYVAELIGGNSSRLSVLRALVMTPVAGVLLTVDPIVLENVPTIAD